MNLDSILKTTEIFFNEKENIKEFVKFVRVMAEVSDKFHPKEEKPPQSAVNLMSPFHQVVHKDDIKRLQEDSRKLQEAESRLQEIKDIMGIQGDEKDLVSMIKSGCYVRCALDDSGECLTCGEKFHLYTTCQNIKDIESRIKSAVFIKKTDQEDPA